MKPVIIFAFATIALFVFAGCVSSGGQPASDADAAKEASDVVPFGLTLQWRVKDIDPAYDASWSGIPYSDPRYPKQGIAVVAVHEGRQAYEKKFAAGDIIYAIDGKHFKTTSKFIGILYSLEPGKPIVFSILRREGDERKPMEISMSIPTYSYTDWDFPLLYGFHTSEYVKRMDICKVLYYNKKLASCRTFGLFPFYHSERVGGICTRRIFWFFKWRTGVEGNFMI